MVDRLNANGISVDQLIERHQREDAGFAVDRLEKAFAREVAIAIIHYRAVQDVSAGQLADLLTVHDDTVATLEDGNINPDVGILRLLSARLGLRFTPDIHPADHAGAGTRYSVA